MGLMIASGVIASVPPTMPAIVHRWQREIAEASLRFAIPKGWIATVINAESGGLARIGGKPTTSPAGAVGLMQLMPSTWSEMRAALGLGSDPSDPHDNILAGTGYLRLMYDRFGYPGLFGAYTAGPERYARYLAGAAKLPSETIVYLAKTTGAAWPSAGYARVRTSERSMASNLFAIRNRSDGVGHEADSGLFSITH